MQSVKWKRMSEKIVSAWCKATAFWNQQAKRKKGGRARLGFAGSLLLAFPGKVQTTTLSAPAAKRKLGMLGHTSQDKS